MSSRHQFHLRWSNYGHNLANSFIKLFESESLADVTLFCDGESYRAHRVVLAASSVHFQELFEQCSGAQNLVVILDGTTPVNLRALLEFMYKGEVYVDDANLNTFLQTAKRLQVKGLSLSQSDLHSISSDVTEDRQTGDKLPTFSASSSGTSTQENAVSQNSGSLLVPQQNQNQQQHQQQSQSSQQQQATLNKTNSVQSPTSYSSPSPSQTPPNPPGPSSGSLSIYAEDKIRKKIRISASPRHQSPDGSIPETVEYGAHQQHPPRPAAPIPSPSINTRIIEMEQSRVANNRQNMMSGFPNFGPMYPQQGQGNLGPPPSPSHSQQHQQQQQTIVITENPNIRKIRSASTENTMPEDLSIKLESGREEEMSGITGKQRSFSMDLSPNEAPFGGLGGGGGPGPQAMWSLPSPSSLTAQPPPHDINPQSTADGKNCLRKKLKCPFCERLYGYETNLRAHIRQRHQGIRVPCPFCTRTFTRNNTVRRHVAREHRALLGGVRAFHHPLNPDAGPGGPHSHPSFGSPPGGSTTSSPSQGSPSTSTSASSSAGSGGNPMAGGQIISGGSMGQGKKEQEMYHKNCPDR
ncbi:unnamed protein product [Orchesella dallaii]|uniref:Broad-complex core protein n=1 Tax=Orchesella dallaii TaxID=48710 RepID=A0ABP1PM78_9HEXA